MGTVGFIFALLALGVAGATKAEISALKKEVESLKAARQNQSE